MSKLFEILLVEDSPSDRFLAMDTLASIQVQNRVHAVKDGVEALDFLRRVGPFAQAPRPDLILLDLHLPRKSGWEVLAALKADRNLSTLRVVVLAAPGDDTQSLRAYPEHADSYLTKPIEASQLEAVIQVLQDFLPSKDALPPPERLEAAGPPEAASSGPAPIESWGECCAGLARSSSDAFLLADARGDLLGIDEAFTSMCGYRSQELRGENVGRLLQGSQTDPAAKARLGLALQAGRSCTEELINYHKDGHPYWVRLMLNPLCGPDGAVRGFLAVEQKVRNKPSGLTG
jgi:chemotaxis family two-component system response regulator Rcp1